MTELDKLIGHMYRTIEDLSEEIHTLQRDILVVNRLVDDLQYEKETKDGQSGSDTV
jgi:hypothetical protein